MPKMDMQTVFQGLLHPVWSANRGAGLDAVDRDSMLNSRPRKRLGHQAPEELFDVFLDVVYAA